MNAPAWPQERLDRWDRITKILARVGGGLLLAATLLPVPGRDVQGRLAWEWWFVDPEVPFGELSFGKVSRTPHTLLFTALGLWSVLSAATVPLAARGRRLALASLALILFLASLRVWRSPGRPGIALEPAWVLLLLPPLGLSLLRTGAARRLGRLLLVVSGSVIVALMFFPHDWSFRHMEVLLEVLRGEGSYVAWGRVYFAVLLAAAFSFLVVGFSRVPNRALERLTPLIWAASALLGLVLPYYGWDQAGMGDPARGGFYLLTVYVFTQALDVGLYLVMGVGLFLWIALQRRPETDPNSWAA